MGERDDAQQAVVMWTLEELGDVARESRLHHGIGGELGLVRSAALELVHDERHLKRHGRFRPERAVVIEDGDALDGWDEVGRAVLRHLRDELADGPLGRAVVPRGQRIGLGLR